MHSEWSRRYQNKWNQLKQNNANIVTRNKITEKTRVFHLINSQMNRTNVLFNAFDAVLVKRFYWIDFLLPHSSSVNFYMRMLVVSLQQLVAFMNFVYLTFHFNFTNCAQQSIVLFSWKNACNKSNCASSSYDYFTFDAIKVNSEKLCV